MGSIIVTNLGKAYKQYPNRWSRLVEWVNPLSKPRHHLHWVLQDINFTVQPGEAVGILGVNGAGKSTLLKLITGTTQPTTGHVHMTGRVAALLELGMGFHPDFTGRQNVLMAGQLLGYSTEEIANHMAEVEFFADIGEYFDKPVRVYSSGMQARVAFSTATMSRPDILIIDEALSVGDMAFQAKCMLRMNGLLEAGTTILFVSHALNQIRQFCSKALYIAGGHIKSYGPADKVCDEYQNDLVLRPVQTAPLSPSSSGPTTDNTPLTRDQDLRKHSPAGLAGGTLDLEFMWFKAFDEEGKQTTFCKQGQKLHFRTCIRANKDVPAGAAVGLLIADKNGYHIFACNTNYYDKFLPEMKIGEYTFVEWTFRMPLALGQFRVDSGIKPEPFSEIFYDRVFCLTTLEVLPDITLLKRNFGGYLYVDVDIAISKIHAT
jgi:lipopolysaccharide transport system ATP-binding protein